MDDKEFLELVARNRSAIVSMIKPLPMLFGPADRLVDRSGIQHYDLLVNTKSGRVEIGKYCFFGHSVMLITGTQNSPNSASSALMASRGRGATSSWRMAPMSARDRLSWDRPESVATQ
jgi:hypothetical protein